MFWNSFTTAEHFHEIKVWRPVSSVENSDAERSSIPVLHGRVLSHVFEAIVAPRQTFDVEKSPQYLNLNSTAKTLYCDADTDLKSSDYITYLDSQGKPQVFEIEGEATNEYISPFSGTMAGREVFIKRIVRKR